MKIDLMIVGAQKCATTNLKELLRKHPKISSHIAKEFSYFIDGDVNCEKLDESKICIAKNVTLCVNEEGIRHLRCHNPNCKIIYLIREPVDRTISAFRMAINDGWMSDDDVLEFIKVLRRKDVNNIYYNHFIRQSLYSENLQMIRKYFDNVIVFDFDNQENTYAEICRIFNIENLYVNRKSNESSSYNKIFHNIYVKISNSKLKRLVKTIMPNNIFAYIKEFIQDSIKTGKKSHFKNESILKEELRIYFNTIQ